MSGPWAIIGDLNGIVMASERKGPPLINRVREETSLVNVINSCNLIDAGFVGDSLGWERDGIHKRLDRSY